MFFREKQSGAHRPDLKQMVVGALLDNDGRPVCSEIWPGNTADVKTLVPVARRMRERFGVEQACLVAVRQAILGSLEEQLKQGPKSLVGNKGYRRYLKAKGSSFEIDQAKVEEEARFDGKWVLRTNTDLPTADVALHFLESQSQGAKAPGGGDRPSRRQGGGLMKRECERTQRTKGTKGTGGGDRKGPRTLPGVQSRMPMLGGWIKNGGATQKC